MPVKRIPKGSLWPDFVALARLTKAKLPGDLCPGSSPSSCALFPGSACSRTDGWQRSSAFVSFERTRPKACFCLFWSALTSASPSVTWNVWCCLSLRWWLVATVALTNLRVAGFRADFGSLMWTKCQTAVLPVPMVLDVRKSSCTLPIVHFRITYNRRR